MPRPDVLLVSLGTTLGWRVADEMLLEQLRRQLIEVQRRILGRPQPRRSAGAQRHGDDSTNADTDPFQQLQSLLDQSAQRCVD